MTIWIISYTICIKSTLFSRTTLLFTMWLLRYFNSDLLRSSMFGRELCKFWWKMLHYRWPKTSSREYLHLFIVMPMIPCHGAKKSYAALPCLTRLPIWMFLYSYLTSDHFVLSVKHEKVINEMPIGLCNDSDYTLSIKLVHWNGHTHDTLSKYTDLTDLSLCGPDFVCDAAYCSGGENYSELHKQNLVLLFEKLTRAMKTSGEMNFPESANCNFTPIPGWKVLLETPYNETRNAYLICRSANKPLPGLVHECIKMSEIQNKNC